MKHKLQKLASLAQEIYTLWFRFFGAAFASKGYPLRTYLRVLSGIGFSGSDSVNRERVSKEAVVSNNVFLHTG